MTTRILCKDLHEKLNREPSPRTLLIHPTTLSETIVAMFPWELHGTHLGLLFFNRLMCCSLSSRPFILIVCGRISVNGFVTNLLFYLCSRTKAACFSFLFLFLSTNLFSCAMTFNPLYHCFLSRSTKRMRGPHRGYFIMGKKMARLAEASGPRFCVREIEREKECVPVHKNELSYIQFLHGFRLSTGVLEDSNEP